MNAPDLLLSAESVRRHIVPILDAAFAADDAPPAFAPGFFADMPSETYHTIEAMSSSGGRKIRQSPLHYRLMRSKANEPTDAMRFGTVCHSGILEPDTFTASVCCVPTDAPTRPTSRQLYAKKPSPETVDAIAYWQRFDQDNAGRIVLSGADHARALRCIDAVRSHPAARRLLEGAETEQSLFWNDGKYGVPCKARLDLRSHGGVTDVKTTTDASPEAFARSAASFEYHAQAAHYVSGCEHVLNESPAFFAFIVVESDEPHAVAVYALPSNAILAGGHLMNIALDRYAAALKAGAYAGYPDTIQTLQLPRWALQFPA